MKYRFLVVLALLLSGCTASAPGPSKPLPPHCFSFAVFGDAPYRFWEEGRFREVIKDVNRSDVSWLIHVGDIFWVPCSDDHYQNRLKALNSIQCPVIYTPGDNEWCDCGKLLAGHYTPAERLAYLRSTFFARPGWSLGAHPMRVTSQAENPAYSTYVENVRWVYGGFVFATVHMVYADRAAESDTLSVHRSRAAIKWMDEAFAMAARDSLHGVVIAMQGDPGLYYNRHVPDSFLPFVDRLEYRTKHFPGTVILIHGDSHIQRYDQPLKDEHGTPYPNFWRIEGFGSPRVGWVRVVVDSLSGKIVEVDPRKMKGWWTP
ncbi:MAG TPA: hypothetical protein VFH88_13860 [Candidatus Krumholzibacteria bacterium]|nr:hypothetical protein [Candidatus Krumholzibacteria bacterium]